MQNNQIIRIIADGGVVKSTLISQPTTLSESLRNLAGEDEELRQKVHFKDCAFESAFTVPMLIFKEGKVVFDHCTFLAGVTFHSCVFERDVIFENCVVEGKFSLSCSIYKQPLMIKNCDFKDRFEIVDTVFRDQVSLHKNRYKKGVNFFPAQLDDTFGSISFEGKLDIY